jgi:hypothetical protein
MPVNVHFTTTGPGMADNKRLKVSIIVEEIYPSIYIEEITVGEEDKRALATRTYLLNGSDIANSLGYKWLSGLHFVEWIDGSQFEMEDDTMRFVIQYTSKREFADTNIYIKKIK